MIDLEEHKVYVESLQMEMIPYSIVKQYMEQIAVENLNKVMKEFTESLSNLDIDLENE